MRRRNPSADPDTRLTKKKLAQYILALDADLEKGIGSEEDAVAVVQDGFEELGLGCDVEGNFAGIFQTGRERPSFRWAVAKAWARGHDFAEMFIDLVHRHKHMLLIGGHGSGSTMLARRAPVIGHAEGYLPPRMPVTSAPSMYPQSHALRVPHHTVSRWGMASELSLLVNGGVLFLDDVLDLQSDVLEVVLTALETHVFEVATHTSPRGQTWREPQQIANFLLIAAVDPGKISARDAKWLAVHGKKHKQEKYAQRPAARLMAQLVHVELPSPTVVDAAVQYLDQLYGSP